MLKVIMAEFLEYNSTFKLGAHHYANMFAKNNYEVLWLSPPWNYLFKFRNKESFELRRSISGKSIKKIGNNIFTYAPVTVLPYGRVPLLDSNMVCKQSLNFTYPNLRKVLEKNNYGSVDILWITNPKYFYLTELVKYKKLIHRLPDDLDAFGELPKSMKIVEEKLINIADRVYMTSNKLISKYGSLREDIDYLPNGCDFDYFSNSTRSLPDEFEDPNSINIVYVGAIDHWFDTDLVEYLAKNLNSACQIFIIGPEKVKLDSLRKYSNVHILGKRDYNDIPNYIKNSHIGIIPFKINDLTNAVNPIKLFEYFACGISVVSTNLYETRLLNSPAKLANNNVEFLAFINDIIAKKLYVKEKQSYIDYARMNSWEARFEKIVSGV